ncbi:MAG TPA: hypothetical protein VFA06_03885 [Actinocrinis sp.]|uniref:hypothetical protein n=1 Tax=Actinocrinis sp. TaxID=1920516 RepID=UPI002D3A701D|nr:hypothetical protein [Actinocrinis sp.]HZU54990.1 hypothetical protein [Actinocrinis sp.]
MSTDAQNQHAEAEVVAAVEEGTADRLCAVTQQARAAQAVAKPAAESDVEAEAAAPAEAPREAGSRGLLGTAKSAFEVGFELRKRSLDPPVREPRAGDGDDAQQDQQ